MKIRIDYVSNSSSSSFMVYGSRFDGTLRPEDFDRLGKDEAYFVIRKDRGSEGDYIFPITPNIMMDCDMHQIELSSDIFNIFKAKYIGGDSGITTAASTSARMVRNYERSKFDTDEYDWGWEDKDHEALRKQTRSGRGLDLNGLRLFDYNLDYGSPKCKNEVMQELEDAMDWHRNYRAREE